MEPAQNQIKQAQKQKYRKIIQNYNNSETYDKTAAALLDQTGGLYHFRMQMSNDVNDLTESAGQRNEKDRPVPFPM